MVAWLTGNDRPMARPTPNFVILDGSFPDVGRLVAAMLKARQAVESRVWSHPQEPTTEEWWADVLADPRAQIRKRYIREQPVERTTGWPTSRASHPGRLQQVRLEGGLPAGRVGRRARGRVSDAKPAQPPRRAGLRQDWLAVGPLRTASSDILPSSESTQACPQGCA